jgi:hypothetical protein
VRVGIEELHWRESVEKLRPANPPLFIEFLHFRYNELPLGFIFEDFANEESVGILPL